MANSGRDLLIKMAATAIAGAQEHGIAIDNSPVDITSISSGGFRELAGFSGTRSLDVNLSGVWGDKVMRDKAFAADSALLMTNITLEFADGGAFTGDFFLASYSETGNHANAVTFTATLQASGAWAYVTAA